MIRVSAEGGKNSTIIQDCTAVGFDTALSIETGANCIVDNFHAVHCGRPIAVENNVEHEVDRRDTIRNERLRRYVHGWRPP